MAEFVMHLIVPDPEGPIESGAGPALMPEVALGLGRGTFGIAQRVATACNLPKEKYDGIIHRGTGSHTPSVNCKFCKATDVFKKLHAAETEPPHAAAVAEFVG